MQRNDLSIDGSGSFNDMTIDQGVFVDQVTVYGDVQCTNGLTVNGTLTGWPWASADVTVEGLLRAGRRIDVVDVLLRVRVVALRCDFCKNEVVGQVGDAGCEIKSGPGRVARTADRVSECDGRCRHGLVRKPGADARFDLQRRLLRLRFGQKPDPRRETGLGSAEIVGPCASESLSCRWRG